MALSTTSYTPPEQAEINRWLTTASDLASDSPRLPSLLQTLNAHLASRTTLLGAKPSTADVAVYRLVAPAVKGQASTTSSHPLSPSLIDLRVGRILKATTHPDADSLYVSTIAVGDEVETEDGVGYENHICRTVCSGLNGLIPLSEMQNRAVIVVCNLKPVKMRGVKSCAMVLAASPPGDHDHEGPVELVAPPEGASIGQRVFFEGWGGAPEKLLNPKKKIWETLQPGFTTTDGLEVAFDAGRVETLGKTGLGRLVTDDGGVCTVKSLKGAVVR
ncbi:methionyl-tRNA synthetase [Ophiocordyceps camponoti-floridani]|uniref:Methionyl-tRNA synthetase n=1 Tax=Ophiocordyceps camponoti-floridani TaxID=2030778 RepID=A0A8H4Q324_9HYPO|nr:methionyl-tRNA synthetase [Ophiocordyceps camponoti-floridani]